MEPLGVSGGINLARWGGSLYSQKAARKQGISVEMPVAGHAVEMRAADEQNATLIAMTADGRVFVGVEPTEPAALSRLSERIVYVKADVQAPHQKVLAVLDALRGKSVVLLSAPPENAGRRGYVSPHYRSAIDRLSTSKSTMKHPSAPEDSLAEHLAIYYWHDKLQLDENGGLLPEFFRSAPPKVRGHLIWFIGSSVSKWGDEVPPIVFDRLRGLFESRVEMARTANSPADYAGELASFGLWFTSRKFGDQWSLSMLQAILDLVGEIHQDMGVGERLVELAPQFPLECVRALATMIGSAKQPWLIMAVEDSAKQVLRIARGSSNPDAIFTARKLAEDLINQQRFGFREVL